MAEPFREVVLWEAGGAARWRRGCAHRTTHVSGEGSRDSSDNSAFSQNKCMPKIIARRGIRDWKIGAVMT